MATASAQVFVLCVCVSCRSSHGTHLEAKRGNVTYPVRGQDEEHLLAGKIIDLPHRLSARQHILTFLQLVIKWECGAEMQKAAPDIRKGEPQKALVEKTNSQSQNDYFVPGGREEFCNGRIAQLVRALLLQRRGPGFKSLFAHKKPEGVHQPSGFSIRHAINCCSTAWACIPQCDAPG